MSIMELIRPELKQIKHYKPLSDTFDYRLHTNESPWSPIALESIALNHYPSLLEQNQLEAQLANFYKINKEELVLTRGSDDGIDFLMRLFLNPGKDSLLQCPPTFPLYTFFAQLQHATVIDCPLNSDEQFNLSLERLFAAWQPHCKLIMLCRPNNPTGNLLTLEEIATICEYVQGKSVVVVDEAYIEFAEDYSASTLLPRYDNLIVLRTLSKALGLAGLRLGCVLGNQSVITLLKSIMAPYLLASPTIALAQRALSQQTWLTESIQQLIAERERVSLFLQNLPWVRQVYPSAANFVFINCQNTSSLVTWLTKNQLAVRDFLGTPYEDFLRITIGDKATNQVFMNLMQEFRSEEYLTV